MNWRHYSCCVYDKDGKEKTKIKYMSDEKLITSTPYDDVFRTMINDCSQLIIPLINEMFGESYTGNEQIVFSPNEHFINKQDGVEDKRITDTVFTIIGTISKKYLLECQSTADNSMIVRIFEYATQIALDQGEIIGDTLEVTIPNCAILFLRSNKNTPDKMHIKIKVPDGETGFDVQVVKIQKYTLDDIFDKNLLFLIPFYIFLHESRFTEYESNNEKFENLKEEYIAILKRLEEYLKQGKITEYTYRIIIEMSNRVIENLTAKYENVKKGVESIMRGQVLEYEAKTVFLQGRMEAAVECVDAIMRKYGVDIEDACESANITVEEYNKYKDTLFAYK